MTPNDTRYYICCGLLLCIPFYVRHRWGLKFLRGFKQVYDNGYSMAIVLDHRYAQGSPNTCPFSTNAPPQPRFMLYLSQKSYDIHSVKINEKYKCPIKLQTPIGVYLCVCCGLLCIKIKLHSPRTLNEVSQCKSPYWSDMTENNTRMHLRSQSFSDGNPNHPGQEKTTLWFHP